MESITYNTGSIQQGQTTITDKVKDKLYPVYKTWSKLLTNNKCFNTTII